MHDDAPPGVEYLDEWDSSGSGPRQRTSSARLLGLSAVVVAVGVVAALGLGATQHRAVGPVTSFSPTATGPVILTLSPTDQESRYQVSSEWPTAQQSTSAPPTSSEVYTPSPIATDLEADPLIITLVDKTPIRTAGTVAYRVSVCVSPTSASVGGGKVRILRENWSLGTNSADASVPVDATRATQPEFPVDGMYDKGECATGYVTFGLPPEEPFFLAYMDARFVWYWFLG